MEPTAHSIQLRNLLPLVLQRALVQFDAFIARFVPENSHRDPELARRARLVAHFGFQGLVFGTAYALFYWLIGHTRGSEIIILCTVVFAAAPWLLRFIGTRAAGHLLVGTMAAGFTQLTLIEGGIHSHAVAWLASVPLCALLLLGTRPAAVWAALCFLIGTSIGIAALCFDVELLPLYDAKWHTVIDAAGNLGIILFLFALGLVFELSRARAFDQMQASLDLLMDSNAQLTHLNNEKTEFLGIAAHDLRNPLAAIIGFAEMLQMEGTPKVAQRATSISKAGRRMLDLITDLLDANAIEEGRYASMVEPVDLRPLVLASMQHNHTASDRKQIPLDLQEGTACWVQADRKAALQILDNLISNALKYSPTGSRVTLTLFSSPDGWSEFMISDQGPGISAADQQKLFLKHTKLTARPTGGESSVGLGLAIVKRLAEAMDGSIRYQDAPGGGSSFVLRLQSVPAALLATPEAGPAALSSSAVAA